MFSYVQNEIKKNRNQNYWYHQSTEFVYYPTNHDDNNYAMAPATDSWLQDSWDIDIITICQSDIYLNNVQQQKQTR